MSDKEREESEEGRVSYRFAPVNKPPKEGESFPGSREDVDALRRAGVLRDTSDIVPGPTVPIPVEDPEPDDIVGS